MRRGAEGESAEKSGRWSGKESDGVATDKYVMNAEGVGWDSKLRTVTEGKKHESVTNRRLGDAMAGGGNTGKASSASAKKAGAGGHHGARPAQRGRFAGRQENPAGESLGVRGYDGGCEASTVVHEYSGVRD